MMLNTQSGANVPYETWLTALASSACIGCTSLVPWFFNLTFFEHKIGKQNYDDGRMKFLLSFAIGAILGDIFFHLIPESSQSLVEELSYTHEVAHEKVGLSVIAGMFMFIIVEMVLENWSNSIKKSGSTEVTEKNRTSNSKKHEQHIIDQLIPIFDNKDLNPVLEPFINYDHSKGSLENNNSLMTDLNEYNLNNNNDDELTAKTQPAMDGIPSSVASQELKFRKKRQSAERISNNPNPGALAAQVQTQSAENVTDQFKDDKLQDCRIIQIAGYLNLIANGFDNFTHGLAIGASFLVCPKVGVLTTFVIFIHEIPHEICDYAILVNSGFSRWDAVKAQSTVSLFGLVGTATALYVKSVQALNTYTVWILPFSAGGFLYIALVNLLPEILERKTSFYNTSGQIACVILGIAIMASLAVI